MSSSSIFKKNLLSVRNTCRCFLVDMYTNKRTSSPANFDVLKVVFLILNCLYCAVFVSDIHLIINQDNQIVKLTTNSQWTKGVYKYIIILFTFMVSVFSLFRNWWYIDIEAHHEDRMALCKIDFSINRWSKIFIWGDCKFWLYRNMLIDNDSETPLIHIIRGIKWYFSKGSLKYFHLFERSPSNARINCIVYSGWAIQLNKSHL